MVEATGTEVYRERAQFVARAPEDKRWDIRPPFRVCRYRFSSSRHTVSGTMRGSPSSTTPLQQQLYQQLSQRILNQRYLPGSRLPSSRQMAQDLGVSRNTVNAAYDQLKAEGFLQSRAGKGIFVHEDIAATVRPAGPGLERPIRTDMTLPSLPALRVGYLVVPEPVVEPVAESAGMHLVLEGDFDDLALNQWLITQGFGSTPLSAHYFEKPAQTGLVMGFASASERQIEDCVAVLRTGPRFPPDLSLGE